jgi:cation diffusion facilitator family transporter
VAKTAAAVVTGSSSLLAEAAHSWADAGRLGFLLVAFQLARRRPDDAHPLGYGREAYVWSLACGLALFVAGATVALSHGIQELINPEPADHFAVGYIVLGVSFVLVAYSFFGAFRLAEYEAATMRRDLVEHVLITTDPTLRAVLVEHFAALIGIIIAAIGLGLHQLTGSPVPDAIGSILVGILLGVVAAYLSNLNRQFLVGREADPRVRAAALKAMLNEPEIARVTYLRLEIVGPRMVSVTGHVDLTGDDHESRLAVRLRALEAKISESPSVVGAVFTPSAPDEPSLVI